MATTASPSNMTTPKLNFPGPVGTKRRRMRSGGGVSTLTNNNPKTIEDIEDEEKQAQTSKCKGATTIPIFLKKTYKMIDSCNPEIASWTADGEMFVVKDPDLFATQVIPQYFDHNKFSSFARQLNFYGFRKMQSKPIRNSDYDAATAKYVTFFNENFKRGRCDLLKNIQRSTRGGGPGTTQDQTREVQLLRDQVSNLEQQITEMTNQVEERMRRLELDMLARMEQMMIAIQQQQSAQLQLHSTTSAGTANNGKNGQQNAWDPGNISYPRGQSITSAASAANSVSSAQINAINSSYAFLQQQAQQQSQQHAMSAPTNQSSVQMSNNMAPPTLPPHPKQKQFPGMTNLPGNVSVPPDRLNSLRGISTLSRGLSGLTRGFSAESSASAVLMNSAWEDTLFSSLMLEEQQKNSGNMQAPTISNTSSNSNQFNARQGDDELSDVSDSAMP